MLACLSCFPGRVINPLPEQQQHCSREVSKVGILAETRLAWVQLHVAKDVEPDDGLQAL